MQPTLIRCGFRFALATVALMAFLLGIPAYAQQVFKPGQVIEYRVGTAVPEAWERGVIIKLLDGGKQYLIHEKPNQFFPKGSERAYALADLRIPAADKTKQPDAGKTKQPDGGTPKPVEPVFNPGPLPKGVADIVPFRDDAVGAKGVLSMEDVLAYARKVFGGADRLANEANMGRDKFCLQIRDYIKKHGTNFQAPVLGKFSKAMDAQGTNAINIYHAVNDNYGAPPKLQDYFGTFLLRTVNRGSQSVKPDATGVKKVHVIDSQHESGRLTINRDGTYEWQLLHTDPPAKWIKGKWREAKADEMFPTEGGPAIWLDHTNGGEEYMVRMCRVEGYSGWIDVGVGPGRRPVQYGRPKAK